MKSKKESLVVIDGNSLLWIGNSGHPISDKVAPDINLGGIHYLLGKMIYYKNRGCDVSVVFDSFTDRQKYIEGYKGQRVRNKIIPIQVQALYEEMKNQGLSVYKEHGKEGDQLVYDLVLNNLDDYENILVLSCDKDLTSIVTDNVRWLNPRKGGTFVSLDNYCDLVYPGYYVPHNMISFYKIILGDKSDNVSSLYDTKSNNTLIRAYYDFCEEQNVMNFYRSFYLIVEAFCNSLDDKVIAKDILQRAKQMCVHINKDDKYKYQSSGIGFHRICEKFGDFNSFIKATSSSPFNREVKEEFLATLQQRFDNFEEMVLEKELLLEDRPCYSNSFSDNVINGL